MKMYVFESMKSLADWANGHLVVMAENEVEMLEAVRERAESKDQPLGHSFGMKTYEEVKEIMAGNTEEFRKPKISEEPDAAGFYGSA